MIFLRMRLKNLKKPKIIKTNIRPWNWIWKKVET